MRTVSKRVASVQTLEGEGFVVRRSFPTGDIEFIDPFLLLDHFGPIEYSAGAAKGAPDHPHRGFETVTYLLEGEFEHRDSSGEVGVIQPGDVQWITAGAGVVHSERPSASFRQAGGRLHGFQLWVNLRARDKMAEPRYQNVPSVNVPTFKSKDGRIELKIIAGDIYGIQSPVETRTPITFLHLKLATSAKFEYRIPRAYSAFIYAIRGNIAIGASDDPLSEGNLAVLANDSDVTRISALDGPGEALLIAGEPINEPVARYGPFVMNSRDELLEAVRDYHSGKMGRIVVSPS